MTRKLFLLGGITVSMLSVLVSCGPSKKLVAARTHVTTLQNDSIKKVNELASCNTQVANLTQEKAFVVSDLKDVTATSKMTIADQAKRLASLQAMIQAQKDVMNNLKNSMADALMSYKSDELNVYIKDGSVYVSLSEKLLFKSGSDVVDPKGVEALKTLARVLANTKDISVMIEGHTDNVPIKTAKFKDNWDLSTARATSIVRVLTDGNVFDPIRITASGKGIYHPLQSNDTAEGRASNRRTEVILSPNLQELFKVLEQ